METPHRDAEPQSPAETTPQAETRPEAASDRGPEASPGSAAGPEAAPSDAGGEERSSGVPLGALATGDLLAWFLGLLAAKAWEGMGLVPNPATGKIQKNLEEARTAIDAYAAILDVTRARLESGPRREIETLLMTLRLNFVEKSAGAASPGGGEGSGAAGRP